MGFLFALAYDPVMRGTEHACLAEWRRALLADAKGDVLEIGAGTGANVPFYPKDLHHLVLAEPDAHMRKKLEAQVVSRGADVELASASAMALPFPDASFDTVVSTLVLCTVADETRALAELHRVLRPGGKLLFLEHVAAEDNPGRLAWQRRVEPVWSWLAEGCHVTRRTGQAIRDAGFVVEREERASMRKAPPWIRPTVRGVAVKAGT